MFQRRETKDAFPRCRFDWSCRDRFVCGLCKWCSWLVAANVGVHAYKPDLDKLLAIDLCGNGGNGLIGSPLCPQDLVKSGSLIVKCQSVPGNIDSFAKNAVRKLKRPNPVANATGHFIDRQTVRSNRSHTPINSIVGIGFRVMSE